MKYIVISCTDRELCWVGEFTEYKEAWAKMRESFFAHIDTIGVDLEEEEIAAMQEAIVEGCDIEEGSDFGFLSFSAWCNLHDIAYDIAIFCR